VEITQISITSPLYFSNHL